MSTATLHIEAIKDLVPKLRFYEFYGKWEEKSIEDLCTLQAGKFISASEIKDNYSDDLFPCYGGNGLRGYTESFNYDGNYSLIGRQGALCGNITFAKNKFYATEHAIIVKVNQSIDNNWMYYMLNILNLNQYATGQAQPGLSVQNIKKIGLCVPKSLQEQQKIASFLSAVDEKIQQLSRKKELLEQYKKGVMQQLFSGKLRFKDENGEDYPDWEEKKLGVVCKLNPKSFFLPSSFIYIDLESVVSGQLLKETRIQLSEAPSRAQRLLSREDILFQMVRPYQKNNLFFNRNGEYVASTGYAQLRAKENSMFLYQLIHTTDFVNKVMDRCTGTSYPAINSSDLANIEIVMPSVHEQQKIADFLSGIDDKIESTNQQITQTKMFKKGLLQQMFV